MKLSTKDGRKYTYVIAAAMISVVLLCVGKITGSEWVTIILGLGGILGVSNVLAKKWGNGE